MAKHHPDLVMCMKQPGIGACCRLHFCISCLLHQPACLCPCAACMYQFVRSAECSAEDTSTDDRDVPCSHWQIMREMRWSLPDL